MEDIHQKYVKGTYSLLLLTGLLSFSPMSHAYMDDDMSIPSDSAPMTEPPIYDDSDDGRFYSERPPKTTHKKQVMNNAVVFNPRTHTLKAYDANGSVVRTFKASGGRNYCPDIHRACHTPTGTFHVISEQGAGCRSSRYPVGKGGSPMPYCMFFSKFYAIHGSHEVPNYNASHGCIRVQPAAAKWLMNNFVRVGTTVKVLPY